MNQIRTTFAAALVLLGTVTMSQTTLNFTVVQNALPQADYTSKLLPDSLSFAFTDSSFGNIIGRTWRFGDGDSAVGNLIYVEHTYATKGVYEVCLEIIDLQNCRDLRCQDANHYVGLDQPEALVENYRVVPNPFREQATIYYSLVRTSQVQIEMYNLAGKKLQTLVNGEQLQGEHAIQLRPSASENQSGVYFIRMTVDGRTFIKKVVELR